MMSLHRKVDHAIKHAAPLPKQRYGAGRISGDRFQIEAPHIVQLDDPDELKAALVHYLDQNKWSTKANYDHALGQVEHEGQHYSVAHKIGVTAVANELAIYRSGFGPFKKHFYEARTAVDTQDRDALAVITAHPEVLYAGDLYDLDSAGLGIQDVAAIAEWHNWPTPLSLYDGKNRQ